MRAVMKPNKIIAKFKLETFFHRTVAVLAVLTVIINNIDGIRVYEGTNFPAPTQKLSKTVGVSKKSLYISKRSWALADEKLGKGDGRLINEKRKHTIKRTGIEEAPALYKIQFNDKNYMQYLRYIKEIPRLEEYTFCLWYKSENLSHDQTLFTYSLSKNELLLRFWINAADSTFRMAIREHPVYKVLANIRENKWHHICQSWNGVLGEWQVFFDGKRIGAGVLSHYKGTYIPEGGEVTLGQELIDFNKRLNDGIDGEIFGFNMVDEAVPQDQGIFINSQYRPNIQVGGGEGGVPPFKKLPPIKKTYSEIKAYISSLPADLSDLRNTKENFPSETSNAIKKPKETYSVPPKRNRGNHRLRYPPLRKVVVYNRDDRQLAIEEALIELNKTKPSLPSQNQTINPSADSKKETPPLDLNYSIHSYRSGKDEKKVTNYEIYEVFEDDAVKTPFEDDLTNAQSLERKAKQNFNLFTARQANKVYTLSSSVKDAKKPKFHFETRAEEPEKSNRRSFDEEETIKLIQKPSETSKRKISDSIPVYEVEITAERKKRSAESRQFMTDESQTDSNGFRRLPQIPENFINIFTQNASTSEIKEKLDQFFPKNNSSQETNVVEKITEASKISSSVEDVETISVPAVNSAQVERFTTGKPIPNFSPIPAEIQGRQSLPEVKQPVYATGLSNPGPVNFPAVQDFNPRPFMENRRIPITFHTPNRMPETVMERTGFDVSSGTDLVMRSYGECTTDRGSPVRDKQHLVISWADTPVRIFGGAQVEGARNQCGYF